MWHPNQMGLHRVLQPQPCHEGATWCPGTALGCDRDPQHSVQVCVFQHAVIVGCPGAICPCGGAYPILPEALSHTGVASTCIASCFSHCFNCIHELLVSSFHCFSAAMQRLRSNPCLPNLGVLLQTRLQVFQPSGKQVASVHSMGCQQLELA